MEVDVKDLLWSFFSCCGIVSPFARAKTSACRESEWDFNHKGSQLQHATYMHIFDTAGSVNTPPVAQALQCRKLYRNLFLKIGLFVPAQIQIVSLVH
jgi:hypothetical protein